MQQTITSAITFELLDQELSYFIYIYLEGTAFQTYKISDHIPTFDAVTNFNPFMPDGISHF